jgi:hypothetical protein
MPNNRGFKCDGPNSDHNNEVLRQISERIATLEVRVNIHQEWIVETKRGIAKVVKDLNQVKLAIFGGIVMAASIHPQLKSFIKWAWGIFF